MKKSTKEQSSRYHHYHMIPNNIVRWPGMTNAAYRLYGHYKYVCGEDGKCWKSLATLSKECGMHKDTLITARRKLEELGLIDVCKKGQNGSTIIYITVVDIWDYGDMNTPIHPHKDQAKNPPAPRRKIRQ